MSWGCDQAATRIQRVYKARAIQWEFAVKMALRVEARRVAKAELASAYKLQVTF